MPTQQTLYYCDVCGANYAAFEDAKRCEEKTFSRELKIGEEVLFRVGDLHSIFEPSYFKVVVEEVIRREPYTHEPVYRFKRVKNLPLGYSVGKLNRDGVLIV